ncbi:MAG: DUF4012 domain-containing protein [Actinomycetota bacterium]
MLGVSIGLQALFLLGVRSDLTAGRDALATARRQVLAGDLPSAQESFARAEVAFQRAADRGHAPTGALARAVPWIGNTADTVSAMADAGVSLSAAGSTVTGALLELPDGIGSLAPQGGTVPVDRFATLAVAIDSARDGAAQAAATLQAAPERFVPQIVLRTRWDAQDQAFALATDLDGMSQLLHGFGAFAGVGTPTHYLVLAQNPAELRGTGGLWGGYAIVTLADGRAHVSLARPTQTLRDFPAGRVPSPSPDYARNYDQFGGAGSWQNMNATPDFPSAATAALANYELGEGRRLDGVIAADPFFLQALLDVTGPVHVAGAGTVSAGNVVDVTTNRSYARYDGPTQRKEVLGGAATAALTRFLAMDEHGLARLKAIATSVADGHLRVFSTNPDIEGALATMGADGALVPTAGDLLAVTVNNGSGSKVDYYAERAVDYDVQLGGEGEALATATVTIANDAPTHGLPRYVIGPYVDGADPGDQIPVTTVSCHQPCEVLRATRDGADVAVTTGSENGVPWLQDYRTIAAHDQGQLALTWRATDVWEGNTSGGAYALTYVGQSTIRPTDVRVTIHAPAGTDIIWTSEPMAVDGNTASWEGSPAGRKTLEVRFRAPMPLRYLRDVTRSVLGG